MRPIVVTGASGVLGGYLVRHLMRCGMSPVAWSGSRGGPGCIPVDLTNQDAVVTAFRAAAPEIVIHAAALARVADCHREPQLAIASNTKGTELLNALCSESRARLLFVSTDLVFDGDHAPYRESDPPSPLSVYGLTKANAEAAVLASPGNIVARVSLLFGPSRTTEGSFFDQLVAALRAGRSITLFADEWRTPVDLATAAHALSELALSDEGGIFHVGGVERLSRLEMGRELAKVLGVDQHLVQPNRREDVPAAEPRPRDTSLDSSRWRSAFPHIPWPGYEEAVRSLLAD